MGVFGRECKLGLPGRDPVLKFAHVVNGVIRWDEIPLVLMVDIKNKSY